MSKAIVFRKNNVNIGRIHDKDLSYDILKYHAIEGDWQPIDIVWTGGCIALHEAVRYVNYERDQLAIKVNAQEYPNLGELQKLTEANEELQRLNFMASVIAEPIENYDRIIVEVKIVDEP